MLRRSASALLISTALMTGGALAQTSSAPGTAGSGSGTTASSGQFMTEQTMGQFRASKFIGLNIYGADNQRIGDINEILIDASGSAKAVVIGVGGFLGIGEKNVAVPFSAVQWVNTPMRSAAAGGATGGTGGGRLPGGAIGRPARRDGRARSAGDPAAACLPTRRPRGESGPGRGLSDAAVWSPRPEAAPARAAAVLARGQ